ncbi:hypothetical protein WSS15_20690 [Acetobacter pasteurianus]|uniref:hypothetical protein n=1 Tax=Acetobacter pasteurianus TaxID=438 RepID=UPI0022BE534D|nr:hypothetical protein [Acetobacter pasteurianus]GLH29419.1 hypothetical protein WSS15_20690 [Acetobacter pasteurianus]
MNIQNEFNYITNTYIASYIKQKDQLKRLLKNDIKNFGYNPRYCGETGGMISGMKRSCKQKIEMYFIHKIIEENNICPSGLEAGKFAKKLFGQSIRKNDLFKEFTLGCDNAGAGRGDKIPDLADNEIQQIREFMKKIK